MIEPRETSQGLMLPDGRVIHPRIVEGDDGFERVEGLMNRSEARQLNAILRSRFFLFRNDGGDYGERMVCKAKNPDGTWRGCGRTHSYITSMCIELPFRGGEGLEQGLWLTFRAAHSDSRKAALLAAMSRLPDLANGHPLTARDLAPKEPGENWLGVLLSLPEPITKQKAKEFAQRINDARPPVKFCMVERCREYLTPSPECALGQHTFSAF